MARAVLATSVAVAFFCSPALAAAHASCSTKNLKVSGAKVLKVQASGLSCTRAVAVARKVASQIATNGSVNVPGVAGLAVSTDTCTGCGGTTTQVTLSYPSGAKLTISIRGGKTGGIQNPTFPQPLPTPSLPSPGSSGAGPITV